VAACSGVVFDAITAAVRPFSPCVLVHHSSFYIYRQPRCDEGVEAVTILSIVSFDWWITAPQPSSSSTPKFPFVITQKISMITSLSTSRPVICIMSIS